GEFTLRRDRGDIVVSDIDWTDASLDGQRIRAGATDFDIAGIEIGLINLDTTLADDVPLAAQFSWRIIDNDAYGSGTADGSLTVLSVEHALEAPVAVQSSGDIRLLDRIEPVFNLLSRVEDLGIGTAMIESGEFRIAGTLGAYAATISASVTQPNIPATIVTGTAAGSLSGLEGGDFRLQSNAYSAVATGSIAWRPGISLVLNVDVENLDPSFANDAWPGSLAAGFRFELDDPDTWRIMNAEVSGSFMDRDIVASGNISMSSSELVCRDCIINLQNEADPALNLTARIDGTEQNIEFELRGEYEGFRDIDTAGTVSRSPGGFAGTIARAVVAESYAGRWVLGSPLVFRTGDDGVSIDAHRWLLPEGQVRVEEIAASPERLIIRADATALPLAAANTYLPSGIRIDGSADASIDLSGIGDDWTGTAQWRQTDTLIHIDRVTGQSYTLAVPRAEADAVFADGGALVESAFRIEPGMSVSGTAEITSLLQNPQLTARMKIEGESWAWITALFPEIDNLDGDISANLVANGALRSPQVGGEATWFNGSVNVPALNVPLRNLNVTIRTGDDASATINGEANAGDGTVSVAGRIDDLYSDDRRLELTLKGDTAEIVDWPEYHLWASPDLAVTGSAGGWDARGTLGIPQAEVEIRELPANTVSISEDVRTADVDYSTSMGRARYSGEARVVLGDAVHVSAFGLDTRLEGELLVRKNPDQEITARGTVRLVEGEFVAYGQRLTIETGTLTFTGPLDDPIIDVRATRTIQGFEQNIVAGIHLTGRAQSINSTVYSDPAMGEADALSYLMIGRPLAQASDTEGNELSNAAIGLGLRQAARITQQIGQSLGLDELTIIGSGGDATALVAGKQLNSRLYARYAYGVFSRLGMIMVRYKLSRRLSLEAGAGEAQSIDLLYSVEKE
ncbi:MAG: translocation/assembly module TamB domain-containing protein, partial [Gammaproteobacteria bacterium]|nr:translocation/assembly module TamB domain-containing protein [Gammaproteobacteria bacterium]